MKQFILLVSLIYFQTTPSFSQQTSYKIQKIFHIASPGGWDYLAVGPDKRLYVSHGIQVNVLNSVSGDSSGVIKNTNGVHGIAFIASLGKGYTSNGRSNNVTVFDIATLKEEIQIPTGVNPDAIMYETYSKRIITCNGGSKNLTLIDPITNKVTATIEVGGKPETAVSDDAGRLFVNIEDKNEIAVINLKTNTMEKHWPLTPAEAPTGLAIDKKTHRLFAGCEKLLVVLDADNGKVVEQLPIGDGCDGVAFDNTSGNIFTSNGAGNMTVIHENDASHFVITETVTTKRGARTITIDEKTHTLYLPAAEFGQQQPGQTRPPVIPGTFQVLVISNKPI
jgi:YVTN family beta-propeller protein